MTFVVLVANPRAQSRTLQIARLAADAVSRDHRNPRCRAITATAVSRRQVL
ncbi:MAG TPA: hypothetical protein VF933_27785 [Streptosporangiaceae bacterium]